MAATIFTLKFRTKMRFEVCDLTNHSMILDSISRRFVVVLNLQNSFPAGSFPRKTGYTFSVSSPQRFLFPLNFTGRSTSLHFVNRPCIDHRGG